VQRELILNFHGIGAPPARVGSEESAVWMSRGNFVALLDHIVARQKTADTPVAITFDDGNLSDVTIALPELCKRRLTATFFICAGRLETPQYLGEDAVRELLTAGMVIGSHGMHHRDWRTLNKAALVEEVSTARQKLESVVCGPVTTAAIPFGSYDRRIVTALRAEGFGCVYTSDGGFARDGAWLKPRNTLGMGSTQNDITHLLESRHSPQSIVRGARALYKRLR
jgi:peptidoglycan/xylan/chitin deacetylase (PgdA/CDA1 family)